MILLTFESSLICSHWYNNLWMFFNWRMRGWKSTKHEVHKIYSTCSNILTVIQKSYDFSRRFFDNIKQHPGVVGLLHKIMKFSVCYAAHLPAPLKNNFFLKNLQNFENSTKHQNLQLLTTKCNNCFQRQIFFRTSFYRSWAFIKGLTSHEKEKRNLEALSKA